MPISPQTTIFPESAMRYIEARQNNQIFDREMGHLLRREHCRDVREMLARPEGWAVVMAVEKLRHHLTRPSSELYYYGGEPFLAEQEQKFYDACAATGLEIPFRTHRILSAAEKRQEAAWYRAHPQAKLDVLHEKPWRDMATMRATPRTKLLMNVQSASAAMKEDSASKGDAASEREENKLKVHVMHSPWLVSGIADIAKARRRHGSRGEELYLTQATYQTSNQRWKGHGLVLGVLFTPNSGDQAARVFLVDSMTIPDRDRMTELDLLLREKDWQRMRGLWKEIPKRCAEVAAHHWPRAAPLQAMHFDLHDPTPGRADFNCNLYGQSFLEAFIRVARTKREVLEAGDAESVKSALRDAMPDYYLNGALRPRQEIERANVLRRWDLGREVLMAAAGQARPIGPTGGIGGRG